MRTEGTPRFPAGASASAVGRGELIAPSVERARGLEGGWAATLSTPYPYGRMGAERSPVIFDQDPSDGMITSGGDVWRRWDSLHERRYHGASPKAETLKTETFIGGVFPRTPLGVLTDDTARPPTTSDMQATVDAAAAAAEASENQAVLSD